MYLKKVEACGFKSFADKTVLTFEQGISGIIGPNGCGKSNISDSIRWCLGEQRAKSMRSSNMQEVIFGGTQTRATTGMAEISLTFDNSQNILPIDYSEVVVTRRLFRSGESEYFINKTQCRFKDIRDMFLDTGVGSSGYSIIEQDKVDFLTTAKPEDRRELFEEASGVSKYKVRREETLKRLEKIDVDMSRLSDVLVIHKQQIIALDIAVKKVKQYKKYQEKLINYEVMSLVRHISYGNNEIARIKAELDPKIKESEFTNISMVQLDTEIQEIRLLLNKKNEAYVSVNKSLSEIKMQIGVADQIIQHAIQREGEVKSEKENLEQELAVNREKVIQMEEQLKILNSDNVNLTDDLVKDESGYTEKKRQYNLVKIRSSELEARENEIREKLSCFESEKDRWHNLKTELSESRIHLDSEIDSLQKMISRLENDIESIRQEIVVIEAELESANMSINSFEAKKEDINKTISKNEEKCKSLENLLLRHKEFLASNDSRVSTLKEFDQQDFVMFSIRTVLGLKNLARGPVSSIINTDEDKQELVASALGERLNYLVCDTIEKAEKAIKFLEENNLSRLSFIVADKILDSVQNSIVCLPQGYTELMKFLRYNSSDEKIIRYICSGTLVSENGNKIYENVVVSGGGKIFFKKSGLIEGQIKNLQNKSGKLKLNIFTIQSKIERIYESQVNLRLEKKRLDFVVIKVKIQTEGKRNQIEERKNDIKSITKEINKYKEEVSSKIVELNSFNEKIFVFETKLVEHDGEKNRLYGELKVIENDTFAAKKEEEDLASLMMEARSVWDKKAVEFENKLQGRQYLLNNIANIKKQIEYAESKIVESKEKLSEFLISQETKTLKIRQLYENQVQKEAEMQHFLADRQSLQGVLDLKINEWHDLYVKADELNSEANAMQVDLKNFEYQKNDFEKKLSETHGKTYEEIKSDFGDIEVSDEEIIKIKIKIESLGSVNLAAQEEYNALEQRHKFLLAQQQDLLKAKDDLFEVVKKINQSTIENFKKTFDIVRDNFKALYRKLFGGGEANLMLTDENNLLESGVDIYAQPPGKKLQNISLCSGGEKALTAVALLFAFFMAKPSPFCILDEVDASLDDVNVGRYNSMIKEFSSKTQFLVITHNKRTMEMVDVLYGVTMEEHGISKIISVKMK
jgi:chromosome segregation protein